MRLRDDPEAAKLATCLAVSLAAHAGLVAWLPALHRHEPAPIPAVLSVALPPTPPPADAAPLAAAPEAPPARAPSLKPALRAPAPRGAPRPPPAPAAVAREPTATSPPVVAAEPPSPEAGPAAPVGPQAGGARAEAAAAAGPRAAAIAGPPALPPSYGAAYLRNPAPRYPAEARREGAEGTVLLRVWVAADGGATRVEIDRSSGHRALDAAALGAVRNWRFVPAQRAGEAVEGVVTVPLVFRLEPGG